MLPRSASLTYARPSENVSTASLCVHADLHMGWHARFAHHWLILPLLPARCITLCGRVDPLSSPILSSFILRHMHGSGCAGQQGPAHYRSPHVFMCKRSLCSCRAACCWAACTSLSQQAFQCATSEAPLSRCIGGQVIRTWDAESGADATHTRAEASRLSSCRCLGDEHVAKANGCKWDL